MGGLAVFNDKQIALIRRTVAKDCDRKSDGTPLHLGELDWFISICQSLKLDPLRRQIYAFVFHKDDPEKRQMVPVIGIGGYRSIAERTGNYRPGPIEIIYDERLKDPDANPLGISHATATVYKFVQGDWHGYPDTAHWEEFAPLKTGAEDGDYEWVDTGEKWPDSGKPKMKKVPRKGAVMKPRLDPKKDGWRKMGRVMIEKCAEAKALRRGWPDDFAGTYAEGELDRAEVLELTATEMADAADTTKRLEQIGGGNQILIDWLDGQPLQPVPIGKLGDQALAFIRANAEEPSAILAWKDRNRFGLREYWAHDKDGALTVNAALEKVTAASGIPKQQAAE